ncbi:hypothetical protein H5410_064165 [Solanum commersonii]|uniref:DUF4283 domain-containing protein n=1 Tax=Solanum commersonii TaxID=4109 RepID=A0A9J5W025_SOLCO|nr:hypothetical protein H5410_064165 [Solanum commersonii]
MNYCQENLNPPAPPDNGIVADTIMDTVTETTEEEKATFKEIRITPYPPIEAQQIPKESNLEDQLAETEQDDDDFICLTDEEKKRIYQPWTYSIIIKIFGKRISHQYLKRKLANLWRVSEDIVLVDLGHDYYIVKFYKKESLQRTQQHGPWFINRYFLSVKRWHPNFVASEAMETYSAIWIRPPELPTEFYDHSILAKVGKKLGKLVKTDVCTSATLRGQYELICVELPIGIPNCISKQPPQEQPNKDKDREEDKSISQLSTGEDEVPWQTVTFTKRRQQIRRPTQSNKNKDPGTNVKLFHAEIGKYLDSQVYKYRKKIISTLDAKNKGSITPRIQNESYTPENLDKIQHTSSISNTDTS